MTETIYQPADPAAAPYVQQQISVFKDEVHAGENTTISYYPHEVQSLLVPGAPKITFKVTQGNWSGVFRAIYITRPLTALRVQGAGPIDPGDMFTPGGYRADVYVQGVQLEGTTKAPRLTPFVNLRDVAIVID